MTFVDRVHDGERDAVLDAIGRQANELYGRRETTVTCPCGVEVRLRDAYRCLYCEIRFCEACARDHFAGDPPEAVAALGAIEYRLRDAESIDDFLDWYEEAIAG